MEAGKIIAYNLKKLRSERNLSLGQLAKMAGVSKVILSQIEKGDANPTINTIWKITGALHLPYTSLLEMPERGVLLIHKKDISELTEEGYHIFSYYAKTSERNFELFQIEMDPGCEHTSIGHSSNSLEYIMVMRGKMRLETGDAHYELAKDDALMFDASTAHHYKNVGPESVKAVLLIHYL